MDDPCRDAEQTGSPPPDMLPLRPPVAHEEPLPFPVSRSLSVLLGLGILSSSATPVRSSS